MHKIKQILANRKDLSLRISRIRTINLLIVLAILLTIPIAVLFVKQRQEITQFAAGNILFNDNFDSYQTGVWLEAGTVGSWFVNFNGMGNVGVETDGSQVLYERPQAATSSSETHSSLVTSTNSFSDLDYSLRLKTVSQLRTPTPNPWETGWVIWHYTDNTHFYYLNLKTNGWELGKEDPAYQGNQRFLSTGSSPVFPIGQWYTVEVKQQNNVITVFVNGAQLTTFTDNERPYLTGSIGLYNEDAYVHFDDVVVTDFANTSSPTPIVPTPTLSMPASFTPAGMRLLPDPLYGVTVDDVANITNIVNSSKNLSHMPVTRIVFDQGVAPSYYSTPINQIQPVSYIMGELLDSDSLSKVTVQQYHDRVANYLAAFGDKVDLWEVGNEVNGNWTGPYADVSSKIYDAYKQVKAAGKRSELTLWYDDGCGNGPSELDPISFSQQYVPADMRNGLDYVTVSYYETQCNNIRPSEATLIAFFTNLHNLYPNARLGFGEIGFPNAVTTNTTAAVAMINYYYGLKINVPGYIGGYFWWYYFEDMLPYTTKPLWQTLTNAFNLEAAALSSTAPAPTSLSSFTPTPTLTQGVSPTVTPAFTPTPTFIANTTLGYPAVGPKVGSSNANTISGSKVTTGANPITVSAISVYIDKIDAAPYNKYEVAIYTNNNGKPGTLVAKSLTGTLIGNSWNTIAVSANLAANTAYWLLYNTNGRSTSVNNMHYTDVTSKLGVYKANTFGLWPGTLNKGSLWTGKFSIYATIH